MKVTLTLIVLDLFLSGMNFYFAVKDYTLLSFLAGSLLLSAGVYLAIDLTKRIRFEKMLEEEYRKPRAK